MILHQSSHRDLPLPRPLGLRRLFLSFFLILCMDIVDGEIISIVPNTPMPSAAPSRLNSVKVPPATPAPAAPAPAPTPVDGPTLTRPPTSAPSLMPTPSPSLMPTLVATLDTEAPSPAPMLNIVQTAPPSALPTFTSATVAPIQSVSRSSNGSTLLIAVLIPVASISALLLLIMLGRRRRNDSYFTKDHRWNNSLKEHDPPLLGATSNNQSAFDDSSIYTKSSYPGGGSSSAGLNGGSTNSAAGWITARNEHPSITEEPTEETDTEDEDDPNHRTMERMEEGSSLYYYDNDTDTETSDSFLSGSSNPAKKSALDDEADMATTEPLSSANDSKLVGILKNSRESVSKDSGRNVEVSLPNDGEGENSNVEVALTNYCGEMHEGIQYDDIVGIDSNSNISGEVSKVQDRESLYISSDCSSTGLTTVSDTKPQPAAVLPIAVTNSRSTGVHPLSFLKRKSKKAEEMPASLSSYITSDDPMHMKNVENVNMDYSTSAESTDTKDMPMSSILHEFNYHDTNTDNSSTIEPFSELTAEYGDQRSVGSDDAIVDANEAQLSESSHPVESSSCDSSAVNVFETDNESNTSSRSATSPMRLFHTNNVDWGSDSKVADPLSRGEDRNVNSFEQLYESISSEWEWKEPSALSTSDVQPPSTYPDMLTLEAKRPDPRHSDDTIREYSYGGRDHI